MHDGEYTGGCQAVIAIGKNTYLVERLLTRFLIASVAAALVGVWNLGVQIGDVSVDTAGYWQLGLLERYDLLSNQHLAASMLRGFMFFIPMLLAALAVSRVWAEMFARIRRRPLDVGWWLAAWYFALLVPATLPLIYVVIALSFGVIFGCHVFGGTGRNLVNPALLGVVFLAVAYPDLVDDMRWIPGVDVPSTWASVAHAAGGALATATAGWAHFMGREVGAIGAVSSMACLLGAALLLPLRSAPFGIVAGGIVGVLGAGAVIGDLPAYEHLALGQFAFLLAFVAADPTIKPNTLSGEWAYGVFFGLLTVTMRMANPDHPESSVFALLLACLCVPLFDEIVRWTHSIWTSPAERTDARS
jgi:Na+-transporting NADH:ubiquinone oxidoreductase subunit B